MSEVKKLLPLVAVMAGFLSGSCWAVGTTDTNVTGIVTKDIVLTVYEPVTFTITPTQTTVFDGEHAAGDSLLVGTVTASDASAQVVYAWGDDANVTNDSGQRANLTGDASKSVMSVYIEGAAASVLDKAGWFKLPSGNQFKVLAGAKQTLVADTYPVSLKFAVWTN